jgi:APA family basic amino acid/polyamine antiporter
MTAPTNGPAPLSRILGLGFSLALAFGNTVGVGILRLPGTVAAALGDRSMILAVWIAGGVYALLGAVSVAELASMFPTAGGFYVYARRTFGPGTGFAVGWIDWLSNTVAVAYAVMTVADFAAELVPALTGQRVAVAVAVLGTFTALHWIGVRIGSGVQNTISAAVGLLLVGLAVICLVVPVPPAAAIAHVVAAQSASSLPLLSIGMLAVLASALRSVIVTYDGWYGSIYMAEETVDASRTVPRAMVGCALMITALYVLINAGFLHALSLPALAASKLPAADAAAVIFHGGGSLVVTIVSLLTVLGLTNAVLLGAPRILYAIGRDGLFVGQAAAVSAGGTPRVALGITSSAAALMVLSGTLEQLIALAAVLYVLNYVSAYVAVFVLRFREPQIPRPFRAIGFPVTTGLVLVGSILFLTAAIADDPRSGGLAGGLILIAAPAYAWLRRRHPLYDP